MSNTTRIHVNKTPVRIHFIVEWAEKRQLSQADISRELGADKGLVSRWFGGTLPKPEYLDRISELFETDIHGLFRHPDDDWLARLFKTKSEKQRDQAIEMLKILFNEKKTGTEN